jgi:DmsE family decaheme c-type cytochrome
VPRRRGTCNANGIAGENAPARLVQGDIQMRIARHLLTIFALAGTLAAIPPAFAAAEATKAAPAKKLVADPNAKDLILKGDAKCTGCHDEADEPTGSATMLELNPGVLSIGKTRHGTTADKRTPTCVDCHGESEKHVQHKGSDKPPQVDRSFRKKSTTTAEARNGACLTCHQGGDRMTWQSSTHATRDIVCSNCHQVHARKDKVKDKTAQTEVCYTCHKEQRAQMAKPSHHPVPEGKMACSSCHNVHGDNPKQLAKATTNETCFTCHMEKRGPFVHNHQPVTEDCGICHQPHGTTVANLLKTRAPFLCQECHNMTGHPGQSFGLPIAPFASGASTGQGTVGRGCVSCHTNIHGSNSTQNSATAGRFRR